MSWKVMRERGGSKAEKLSEKLCEAKELIADVCEEIEEMEDYFQERDDDDRYMDRDEMRERLGRRGGRGRY